MKLTTPTIGVLATIVILASVGAFYAGPVITDLSLIETSGPSGAAFMVGNVKVTHFDKDGQVLGYRQGTNHITANGMMVIMGQVFYGVNDTIPDQVNVSGTVRWMEVGTGGDTVFPFVVARDYDNALRWNDTDIVEPIVGLSPSGFACLRVSALIGNGSQGPANTAPEKCNSEYPATWDGISGADDCNARHNVTATADFDGADCEINGIDEAGIFTTQFGSGPLANDAGTMFARNTFGSVNLGPLDTLRLEWEFTFTDS